MSRTYVTLNISASAIKLLSVRGRQIETWKAISLPPGLVKDGLITKPKVVGKVIDSLLKEAKLTNEPAIISLTGLPFTYRLITLPRMNHAAQREAIERAAGKEMQLPLEELYLSWDAVTSGRGEHDFFILGVPRKVVDAAVQTLEEAGVKTYIMDTKPLALARAASQEDAIIVDLEPECFDITIVANGKVSTVHSAAPKGEEPIVENNIRRLSDELSKTVDFYNDNHPQNPISPDTPLLLTGELAAGDSAAELIQNATGYSAKPLTPPLQMPGDLPVAEYTANIGLAMKRAPLKPASRGDSQYFKDININILSRKYRTKDGEAKRVSLLLTTVLLIGAGLLYPVYQLRNQAVSETAHLQADLASIRQELDTRLLDIEEAAQIIEAIAETEAQTAAVKEQSQIIPEREAGFADVLELATSILPNGASFTSVELASTQIIVEGEADSPFTVVNYVVALEETGRFSEASIAMIDDNIMQAEGGQVAAPRASFRIIIDK